MCWFYGHAVGTPCTGRVRQTLNIHAFVVFVLVCRLSHVLIHCKPWAMHRKFLAGKMNMCVIWIEFDCAVQIMPETNHASPSVHLRFRYQQQQTNSFVFTIRFEPTFRCCCWASVWVAVESTFTLFFFFYSILNLNDMPAYSTHKYTLIIHERVEHDLRGWVSRTMQPCKWL